MDEVGIIIRPFDQIQDQAMIYSTWRNSSYYSALNKPEIPPSKFFQFKTKEITNILDHASIRIACFQDDPMVIVGYSVYTGTHLEWIYVKDDFRKQGIGTMLMPKEIKTVTAHLTKVGKAIADKKKLVTKGESNGRIEAASKDPKESNPALH